MHKFTVIWLTDDGQVKRRSLSAVNADAAIRTTRHMFGGAFHEIARS